MAETEGEEDDAKEMGYHEYRESALANIKKGEFNFFLRLKSLVSFRREIETGEGERVASKLQLTRFPSLSQSLATSLKSNRS